MAGLVITTTVGVMTVTITWSDMIKMAGLRVVHGLD